LVDKHKSFRYNFCLHLPFEVVDNTSGKWRLPSKWFRLLTHGFYNLCFSPVIIGDKTKEDLQERKEKQKIKLNPYPAKVEYRVNS
jgi:hypothetical protein